MSDKERRRNVANRDQNSLLDETTISQNEVPSYIQELTGRRLRLNTIYRWQQSGVKSIRLEYVQLPSGRVTSKEAVRRFFLRLSTQSADLNETKNRPKRADSVTHTNAVQRLNQTFKIPHS